MDLNTDDVETLSVDAEVMDNKTLYCFDISNELKVKQEIKLPNYIEFYYVSQIFVGN